MFVNILGLVIVDVHDVTHVRYKSDSLLFQIVDNPTCIGFECRIGDWLQIIGLGLALFPSVMLRVWDDRNTERACGCVRQLGSENRLGNQE